jgi:hypothetical protein
MGCRTSFQLRTVEVGGDPIEIARPDPEPPCDMPAAECADCRAVAVYQAGEVIGCASCGARLSLSIEEVDPPTTT